MKRLTHAAKGDLAKTGERRLGGDRAEAWLDGKRLQELRSAHRFAESEDTVWMIASSDEVKPLVDIVAFEKAVGGELATARSVGASIG